jgi:hypothetical protein
MPGEPGVTVVTTLVCSFYFACEAAGAIRAPGIPCALSAQTLAFVATLGERIYAKLGQVLPRDREGVSKVAV